MSDPFSTHDVTNQPPPFEDVDLLATDAALTEAVKREGGAENVKALVRFAKRCGSAAMMEQGRLANEHPPRLRTFDRQGRRLDTVEFHPAYHACMSLSIEEGLHSKVWDHLATEGGKPAPGINVERAAGLYLAAQVEAGHCCPVTMTNAVVPSLRLEPGIAREWLPRITTRAYDPRFLPAGKKRGVTLGMGMTEKQGGTDVRANTSRAEPAGGAGEYVITGHKWFMSAPMCDAFLMLAQAKGGLTCFLVPRFRPDGTVNSLRLQRLKDKLGNRSNASSEVELQRAHGWRVGEEGRGVPTIIEMVTHTRLDCAVASAGLMRMALASAIHHTRHRHVGGRALIGAPLMRHVLADLALDVEAATALSFRLARAFDRSGDERAAAWRRLMTPVTKYWVCKIAAGVVAEAMECHGGNGYVEELPLARIYREVPVNAIWEGSGNVMALDVLRVLQREPETADVVIDDMLAMAGKHQVLAAGVGRIRALLHDPTRLDVTARALVELLAVTGAGVILRSHAPTRIAEAFIATRIAGPARHTYGQGLEPFDVKAIVERALPG